MKKRIFGILLSFLMAMSSLSFPVMAQEETPVSYGTPGIDYIEGEVIACVNGGVSALTGKARNAETFQVEEVMDVSGATNPMARSATKESLVFVKGNQDTASLIAELQSNPNVIFAEPNYRVELCDANTPTDPYYPYQWGLDNRMNPESKTIPTANTNVSKAWGQIGEETTDDPVVAVVDTGVDYNHDDLNGVMWKDGESIEALKNMGGGMYGYNTFNTEGTGERSDDPMDSDSGHGTHCAGIIAAQWNNLGVSGTSPRAEIMAIRAIGNNATLLSIIKGYAYIQAAKQAGVNVVAVNNSWRVYNNGALDHATSTAVTALGEQGIVSCFGSGNDSTNNDANTGSNVNSPYCVTVGAIESEGYATYFSNYGQESVDVFAPGSHILSTVPMDTNKASDLPGQYLPQMMDSTESYLYEDFEGVTPKVTLALIDENDQPVASALQTPITPGYTSAQGTQISLDTIANGEQFSIEMQFEKSDLAGIDQKSPLYLALQGGCTNAMYGETFLMHYKDADGKWQILDSIQMNEGKNRPVRLRLSDHNWNQSSFGIKDKTFLNTTEEIVSLRLTPIEGIMEGKTDGVPSSFKLDDIGFGKTTTPYSYSDGTSMASPAVAGIAALLASKADNGKRAYDAAEVCARIKGGVNREDAIGLSDKSVSGGFVDVEAAFDDTKVMPVLNGFTMTGNTGVLTGYFFGSTPGRLSIGGTNIVIDPENWSDQKITFTVPEGMTGKQQMIVTTIDGREGQNHLKITADTVGYIPHQAPNIDYGIVNGYALTSADVTPMAMTAANNQLFYIGEFLESGVLTMESYDRAKDQWEKNTLPENMMRAYYSMTGGLTKVYLLYNEQKDNVSSRMLGVYDPETDRWECVETELSGTESLVVYKNQLLAIGGEDTVGEEVEDIKSTPRKTVKIMDPKTGKSIGNLPDLPEGRSIAKTYASGDTLVVQGGSDSFILKFYGKQTTDYHNTMTFDGTKWIDHKDNFLVKTNSAFDANQGFDTAVGAVDTGLIVTGPVKNLGQENMIDTWHFNLTNPVTDPNALWSADTANLYSQTKITRNMGVSYDGEFYVLGYTGSMEEPLIFRSTKVSYTGPTADPKGKDPVKPVDPDKPVNPDKPVKPEAPGSTGNKVTNSTQNVHTGVIEDTGTSALICAGLLILLIGGCTFLKKKSLKN
ncbi:MAG: S8 family serine peptidase [Eubacterium sp.]